MGFPDIRLRRLRWSLTVISAAALYTPALAATPAQICQAAKNKEAGKYDACRQKAEAGLASSSDIAKYTAALAGCLTKYQSKWSGLEAKAVAQGGAYPSAEDQASIQRVVDQHTTNIATALGGGVLQDCPSDLLSCTGGLTSCNSNLSTCQSDLATCQAATPQGQRLKTGQALCFDAAGTAIPCAGTGQDGELQKGTAQAYVDNGDGTITDTKTSLMWEKLSADGSIHGDTLYDWTTAFTKVAALNSASFAGFNDWRLPNVNELQSLADYGVGTPAINAAFNTGCVGGCTVLTCSCTESGYYWASTSLQHNPTWAWSVNFDGGYMYPTLKSLSAYARAVRGGS